jgi:hypothetical protein
MPLGLAFLSMGVLPFIGKSMFLGRQEALAFIALIGKYGFSGFQACTTVGSFGIGHHFHR